MDELHKYKYTTKQRGDAAEEAALEFLCAAGLALVARNYRTPGRGGGVSGQIGRASWRARVL